MTEYTAEDFARAEFARHPDGRIAHRVNRGTWLTTVPREDWTTWWGADRDMAEGDWIPATTAPAGPASVDDVMVERAERERDEARVRGGKYLIRAEKAERMRDRWKAAANSADDVIRAVLRELGAGPDTDPVLKAKAVCDARDAWREVAKRKGSEQPRTLRPASVDDVTALWDRAEKHPEGYVIPAGTPFVGCWDKGASFNVTAGDAVETLAHTFNFEARTLRPATPTRPAGAEDIEAALMGLDLGAGKNVAASGYRGMADALAARLAADGWTREEGR